MSNPQARKGVSLKLRSGVWLALAIVFLLQVGLRIHRDTLAGRPIAAWAYVQLVVWSLAFCFWAYAALRAWKPVNQSEKVL